MVDHPDDTAEADSAPAAAADAAAGLAGKVPAPEDFPSYAKIAEEEGIADETIAPADSLRRKHEAQDQDGPEHRK